MYPLLFTVAVVEGVSNSIYRKERPAEYCQDESGTLFLLLCPNYCQKIENKFENNEIKSHAMYFASHLHKITIAFRNMCECFTRGSISHTT